MSTSSPLWFCVYFPYLPVEVFYRQVRDKPVVVLERQRVMCMNAAAYHIGIRPGSSMNTAYTISDLVTSVERDEEKEQLVLENLAQWAYQFTPNVAVKAPHCLLLDVTGCLTLFGGEGQLIEQIVHGLDALGFQVRIGSSQTPLSALLMAESGCQSLEDTPVHHLRVDQTAIESLHRMGISHCEQLLKLPPAGLNKRFGTEFTDYLERLLGDKSDPQEFISHHPKFHSDITFLSDVTNILSLVFPLKRLLGELQDFLRARQLMVNQFTVQLSHRSHGNRQFVVHLASPEHDAELFLMLCQLQLEKITDLPEVDNLLIRAETFFESEAPSGDLFHGTRFQQRDGSVHSKAEEARAVRLLNMMTARLGQGACFSVVLDDDHRPERAWKPVSISDRTPHNVDPSTDPPRPMFLLPKPKALICIEGKPSLSGELTLLQGPERIDCGWWDHQPVSRDYYIARHKDGALYWVFQHLDDREWYLHGIFS